MSNFDFLKDFDNTLWKLGNRIEKQVNTSPSGVKADATTFLEHILKKLLTMAGLKYNSRKPFTDQVDAVFRSNLKMSNAYRERIKSAYNYRNKIHDEFDDIEKHEFEDAVQLHEKLFYIARKFYRDYNDDYDEYKGVPDFKPLKFDFSTDEVEMVKVKDFNEIVDVKYDYCVVCGQPNHLNYSIYCHKCSRKLDNANNFISVRNAFGKDARFTKEDLIEYGMPEGYVNQFINSMVRENMLKVAGRFITFNNMYLEEYLKRIDSYISVGELITRFKEDKISPEEIKKSKEYKLGKNRQEPFYQFYKITNREIIKKFEKDLLATEDIWKSIDYTAVTQHQLERWYNIRLGNYRRGNVNESFVIFNKLLIKDYLKLKSEGILEAEIRKTLNISDEVYEFWCDFDRYFEKNLKQIKLDLIVEGIDRHMTKGEIIEYAGLTAKEYDDIFKVADRKGEDIAQIRKREIESRKRQFVKYLLNFDLKIACSKALFTLDDFYEYYDSADVNSEFYVKSTRILMDKYLTQRRFGRTREEAIEKVGIKEKYLDRWLKRSVYADFKDEDLRVTVELILKGFKKNKPLIEIAQTAGVTVNAIKSYVKLGGRGSAIYKPLYDYYESEIIPQKLDKFLNGNETKSIKKAMESADLTEDELDKYYELGKNGDERFEEFYKEFYDIKKGTYVYHRNKGKSHNIAMRESRLSDEEYDESKADIEKLIRLLKISIVLETVASDKTSNVAASKAGCTVDEIYEWYFKGRSGDEDYKEFYESFHKAYVRPSAVPLQEKLDNENAKLDNLIKSNKDKFTKKDVDIWLKHGIIHLGVIHLDEEKDDEDEDDEEEKVKKFNLDKRIGRVNPRSSLGGVQDNDDIEELKRQILKK
ncbi:hypothetical protein [Methanobrevibacter sp. UBA212]|uniref:hypothetical protein n=3 Tax=Methanobrevibacter TaxID=2172 RepID=UPI0025D4EA72|nr:hypothetical protein [Methanobrevibacter sp. UBA212]